MRAYLILPLLLLTGGDTAAQELFPATEPASNMPNRSIGFRTTAEGTFTKSGNRFSPELMVGASKDLMLHGALFYSDFYQPKSRYEGYTVYGKYRFLTRDTVQRHFRGAVYARYAHISNPPLFDEVNLEGDNSGIQGGLVFTQLLHKLAVSLSAGYLAASSNGSGKLTPAFGRQVSYSLSAGYLLFPENYTSYDQVNMNLYIELLGKSALEAPKHFLEAAPAVQFIFGSRLRADFSKRVQLNGNMSRPGKNIWVVKLEYTLFNVF